MNPAFTSITLNPAFFMSLVILLLHQLFLANRNVTHLKQLLRLEISKALMAPMILVVATNIIVTVATNTLGWTVSPIAVENRRLKEKLLASTEKTGLSISPLDILFSFQLLDEGIVVMSKLVLHFLRHVVNNRALRVIQHGIVKSQMHMAMELFQRMIAIVLQLLANGSKVHWLLDNFEVIWQTQFHRIHRAVEDPAVLVALKDLENLQAFGLELLRREL